MSPLKHKSEEPGLSSKLLGASHWVLGESQGLLMAWTTPELSLASPLFLTPLFSALQPQWPVSCFLTMPSALWVPDLHACLFPTMGTFFPRQQHGWLHLLLAFVRMPPYQGSCSLNNSPKIAVPDLLFSPVLLNTVFSARPAHRRGFFLPLGCQLRENSGHAHCSILRIQNDG